MKKLNSLLLVLVGLLYFINTAQATIPLEPACVGESYEATVSIVLEEAYYVGGSRIDIDLARFFDVFGLPEGLRYSCGPCSAAPGGAIVVRIFGTPTLNNRLGVYDLQFSAELVVNGIAYGVTFPYLGFEETAYSIELQDCDDTNCYMPIDFSTQNATCEDKCDGSATAFPSRGIEPYFYQWDYNAGGQTTQTAEGLCSGIYWVTITDAVGCKEYESVSVGYVTRECAPDPVCDILLTTSVSNATCPDSCNGRGTILATGGVPPYSYEWGRAARFQRTATATGLCPGTYEVTISDRGICDEVVRVTIGTAAEACEANQPDCSNWSVTISTTQPTCASSCTGEAMISPVGGSAPYSYKWDAAAGNATVAEVRNLCAATYAVTVTDSEGCMIDTLVVVEAPKALRVDALVAAPGRLACGEPMQAICQTRYGTPPYTYKWSTGATTSFVNSLPLGISTVTVTDANGCTASRTFTNIGGTESNKDCDLISFSTSDPLRYSFAVPDSIPIGVWTATAANSLVNMGNSRSVQHTFPSEGTYTICYTYQPYNSCTMQCCKTVRIQSNIANCPPLVRSFDESSQDIVLSLPEMENISWSYADTLVRDSILHIPSPETQVVQDFTLTYLDASCNCYRQCRSTVNLCPLGDENCWNNSNLETTNTGNRLQLSQAEQRQVVDLYNFPNPWSGRTTFRFTLPEATSATLEIINANGQRVFSYTEQFAKGAQTIELEQALPAGIYFYRLVTPTFAESRSMMVND